MRNEAGDIVQDQAEDLKQSGQEWLTKARAAGTAAWDATRATYQQIQDKTIEYSKVTDQAIREKPYVAVGIAFGVGMLIGLLATSGKSSEKEDED
jgi:ElaB/YqjD/DUF883 family membrane-anchored ribosome-binding protein